MTAKEYLRQAYRLDHRINSDLAELERLRDMEGSISSPSFEEHYNPNRNTEAPFIRCLEKVWDLEMKIKTEIDKLIICTKISEGICVHYSCIWRWIVSMICSCSALSTPIDWSACLVPQSGQMSVSLSSLESAGAPW